MKKLHLFVVLMAALASLALAPGAPKPPRGSGGGGSNAQTGSKTPPAAAVPRVVLTLIDGKSISGEFVEVSPAGMTLKQNAKSDPVFTPWSQIKHASNKMTHDSVVAEWQKTKRDQLCDSCVGTGATTCPTCEGTGVDPAQKQNCTKCEGTGSLGKCKTANCVEGKIPCPNTCLKPEMFTSPPDPKDGKKKKHFRGKGGGDYWWSDGHIGELIVYEDGVPVNKGKCPKCDGTSRVVDTACKGTGKQLCADCHGHGVVGPDCTNCDDGQAKCATCSGTGLKVAAAAADPAATPAPPAQ